MAQAFEVVTYSKAEFIRLLSEKAGASQRVVSAKEHVQYFDDYLGGLGAKTVVVENSYIDRDFLDDFANYYVRCFKQYSSRCTRLHFFSSEFDEGAFSQLLRAKPASLTDDDLTICYLGFMVVKPLPQTIVGRTCFRTYPPDGRRHFPVTRKLVAHLFGKRLCVDSLPFQEQERAAAACATSALWSAFQATGRLFQHRIPSPMEITRVATEHVPLLTRTFPATAGLNKAQMAEAIRGVGLEPCLINATDEHVLKSTLYAYLRGGIPIILLIKLHRTSNADRADEPLQVGSHAVTAVGYSLSSGHPVAHPQSGFRLSSIRLDKVYVHDDQIGPFTRMEWLNGATFTTTWQDRASSAHLIAHADLLLIPLYHIIRIPLDSVVDMVSAFDSIMELLRTQSILTLSDRIEWDVYLISSNTLKEEIHSSAGLSGEYRESVLTLGMPRFLWRATALDSGRAVLDLLFDTTDIEQGLSFIGAIEYDAAISRALRVGSPEILKVPALRDQASERIFEWFANPPY
ncbi:MAG TPA: hypothetical protein VFJ58_26940 [Armatimonadota bacterium]|nr:hypothetical protein [Armatimonadota bacterium]